MDSTNCERVSVFCVDDHAGFREILRDVIGATPGFELIGEASSGVDALALVADLRPDLVLMDVHMPGMSGFEAAAQLTSDRSDLMIVLMSADPIDVPRGFGRPAGALAIVTKSELRPRRLIELWNGRQPRDERGSGSPA